MECMQIRLIKSVAWGSASQIKSDTNSSASLETCFKQFFLLRNKCSPGICQGWSKLDKKKICVNTLWRIILLSCLNLFEHHQQSVCAVCLCNNHRVPIRQGNKGTIRFGMRPLGVTRALLSYLRWFISLRWSILFYDHSHSCFFKCFDDRSWEIGESDLLMIRKEILP